MVNSQRGPAVLKVLPALTINQSQLLAAQLAFFIMIKALQRSCMYVKFSSSSFVIACNSLTIRDDTQTGGLDTQN